MSVFFIHHFYLPLFSLKPTIYLSKVMPTTNDTRWTINTNYYYLGTCVAKLMRFVLVRMEQVRRRGRQVLHRTARSRRIASGQFGIVAGTGTGNGWRGRRKRVVEMSGRRSVFPRRRSRFGVRAVTQRGQVWRRVHQATWFQRRKEKNDSIIKFDKKPLNFAIAL